MHLRTDLFNGVADIRKAAQSCREGSEFQTGISRNACYIFPAQCYLHIIKTLEEELFTLKQAISEKKSPVID